MQWLLDAVGGDVTAGSRPAPGDTSSVEKKRTGIAALTRAWYAVRDYLIYATKWLVACILGA